MNEEKRAGSNPAGEKLMMGCGYSDDWKAFLDNELPLAARLRLRSHLARCGSCREALLEMERMGDEMKKLGAMESALSAELRARLVNGMRAAALEPADIGRELTPFWKRKPLLVFGGGGATVAASLLVFMALYQPINRMESAQAPMAAAASASAPKAMMESNAKQFGHAVQMYTQDYDEQYPAALMAKDRMERLANGPVAKRDLAQRVEAAPAAPSVAEVMKKPAVPMASRQVAQAVPPSALSAASSVANDSALSERKVRREASLGVAVTSVDESDSKIVTLVEASGGFVASNNLNTNAEGGKYAELSVRVPVKEFETILAEIGKLGELRSKNIVGEDITEQVSDATSDEQVLMNETDQLIARLKAGGTEKRIAATETELRSSRLQLARARARLGLLRKLSSLSTIQVTLTEKPKKEAVVKPEEPPFIQDLRETNRAAMTAFQAAVRVPIVMIVWILAFSPLWAPLILAYRWAAGRDQRKTG